MRRLVISSAILLAGASPALSAPFTINAGTDTSGKTVTGSDIGSVAAGAALSTTDTAITWEGPSPAPGVTIDNNGTIESSDSRGIDTDGGSTVRNFTLNNNAGAVLSADNDAFRIDSDVVGGTIDINNAGTIFSDGGQALDFGGIESNSAVIQITNAATGIIESDGNDAIRPGSGSITIDNSGLIDASDSDDRAINLDHGGSLDNVTTFSVTNQFGGTIISQADAIRATADSGLDTTTGTFTIDNSGTITATNGGQAIDFDDIESTAATVTITNRATGIIQAAEADAIRPGEGATVTNFGIICVGTVTAGTCSGGVTGESDDGIDWQGHAGTIVNSGTISGQRHGTTSDVDVDVTNETGGVIIGRNGSGVGSDGDGTVLNHGTITGAYDGAATDGDGDGVDIDFIADITNFGTIQGTGAAGNGSDGKPNTAQGLALGGGTVDNRTGAVITGAADGILVDDSSTGGAFAATTIANAGRIEGFDGYGIRLVGTQDDTVTNSGIIAGATSAIDLGGGNDLLTLDTGSTITGLADGGDGFDTLDILGAVTLGETINFEQLILESAGLLDLAFDLHVDELLGAIIDGNKITNIAGNGFNFFYDPANPDNAYLGARTYLLADGGKLTAVPEPLSLGLLAPAVLITLTGLRRRRRAAAA